MIGARQTMTAFLQAGAYLLFGIMSLFMIATATSAGFAIHGVIILVACLLAAFTTLRQVQPSATGGWYLPDRSDGGYHDGVIKAGVIATVFWGVVGFLVGVVIAAAADLSPDRLTNIEWLNFGVCGRCTPRR
jgi:cytochrome c oxidase cbb3-type subunit I